MLHLMRILVTGGAGFIGSHISDALIAAGHEVLVLDDLSTGRRENVPPAAKFVEADIRDGDTVARVVADFSPHVLNHQAAQVSVSVSARDPVFDAQVNVIGTINLLQACVRHGAKRFVFASTGGAMYGEVPEGQRANVQWPTQPLSPYGCAKLAAEGYLGGFHREYGIAFSILRYANVYGPRQDPHGEAGVVAIFGRRLLRGEPIQINARRDSGDSGCVRDYVFVSDVVRANLLAVAGELPGAIVNVCTGVPSTTLALAKMMEQAAGITADIGFAPRRLGDLERSVLEASHGERLGEPVPLEKGIAQTVAWFREEWSDEL